MENNKVILITGASRGIGREIALAFAAPGNVIFINYIKDKAAALDAAVAVEKRGAAACVLQADVSDFSRVQAMVKETAGKAGRIDVLINNAGITRNRSIIKMPPADWHDVMRTNLDGAFFLTRECGALMAKNGGGAIINIASIIGVRGAAGCANYAAAKAGLIALTKSAAIELGRFKVRVNAVLPGFHLTGMGKTAAKDYIERARAESVLGVTTDVAELAAFVVFLSQTITVSGQVFNWDSRVI